MIKKQIAAMLAAFSLLVSLAMAPQAAHADTRISQLETVTDVDGNEEIPVNDSGTTRKITIDQIINWDENPPAHTHGTADITSGLLGVARGGSGAGTFTANGVLLGNTTSAFNVTAAGAAYQIFRVPSGGGAPAFGSIDLSQAAAVTGTLPVGNGGTGATTLTSNGVLLGNTTGAITATTAGAANEVFRVPGGGGAPAFGQLNLASGSAITGELPNANLATVSISKGGTGQTTQTAAMDALSPTTTKGDILVDNGTSVIRLPVGANGTVLTGASGEASGLQWATPSTSKLVFIASATASGSATIDFTSGITSTYDKYIIEVVDLVPATDATQLYIRVSDDNGSTFEADAADYEYMFRSYRASDAGLISTTSAGAAQISVTNTGLNYNIGNAAGEALNGTLTFWNPAGTARHKMFRWQSVHQSEATQDIGTQGSATFQAVDSIEGIRFLMSSGNITSGSFYLYGVSKNGGGAEVILIAAYLATRPRRKRRREQKFLREALNHAA
ncbi:MAG TPA: hypothetical protein VD994_09200 [Prosthecobacter sp.]|nr:hypothetical protein [Prosthecobacter sp.]